MIIVVAAFIVLLYVIVAVRMCHKYNYMNSFDPDVKSTDDLKTIGWADMSDSLDDEKENCKGIIDYNEDYEKDDSDEDVEDEALNCHDLCEVTTPYKDRYRCNNDHCELDCE